MKFNLTPHQRNREAATRWIWRLSGSSTVYQKIRTFRHAETVKSLLGETHSRVVVTDQCASYHWRNASRHQFCWVHVTRNGRLQWRWTDGLYRKTVSVTLSQRLSYPTPI
ncbi:IS66 family transposase [Xenorhabdus bovienii]|uniref:IS66 family transposase n=1 Tax=Xenorhabdus bovienii TaxID=40576 RepID=UPI0020CA8982|nr:transposase [Xenorhabdus bovienii]MCP9268194.1 transposase [Xenorhabdus bovienii subsp. africana]